MSQTSYSSQFSGPYQGLLGDLSDVQDAISMRNTEAVTEMPYGVAVAQDPAADDGVKMLAAVTDKIAGIGVFTFARDPNYLTSTTGAVKPNNNIAVLRKGRIWVPVDQAVGPSDPVYARCAASANGQTGLIGSFRKDADGAAAVLTLTPTAVNNKIYQLRVEVGGKEFEFEFQASAATSAAEIVTGFKTVMAADAEFSALVTATGVNTLILTGVTAGASLAAYNEGDGAIAVVTTTAPAATAQLLKGCTWVQSGTAGGLALLDFDLATARS